MLFSIKRKCYNLNMDINELQRIKKLLAKQQSGLNHEYGVSKLALFGSFARGEENAQSDVDILVAFDRPIGLFRFVELETKLSEMLNRRVDLVTEDALKPAIKPEVLKDITYV